MLEFCLICFEEYSPHIPEIPRSSALVGQGAMMMTVAKICEQNLFHLINGNPTQV